MRFLKQKKICRIGFFLLLGMLLPGCGGKGAEQDAISPGEDQTGSISSVDGGAESASPWEGQTQDGGSEMLTASYRSVSLDMELLGMENQLLDLQCLAVENGVYGAGERLNQGRMETAVYRIRKGEEPDQVLSLPEEALIAWCRTQDGIAILGQKAETTESGVRKLFVLHTFGGEALEEAQEWLLTDAFEEAEIGNVAFGDAMAMEGENLILSEKMGKNLYVVDLAAEKVTRTIAMELPVEMLQYDSEDMVSAITMNGDLHTIRPSTGGVETKEQAMFGQYGAMQHWFIGKDRIWGGSAQGLHVSSERKERKLADYAYGLEPLSSLWMEEGGSRGILAGWNQETRKLGIYFFSDSEQEAADDREVLTMYGFGVDEEYRKAASEFNQSSDEYRIEVLEEEGAGIEDMAARLETQLMSGQGADLLLVSNWAWFRDYAENGYLEDLMPYIQRDLNPEDYVQSALFAYRKGEAVYAMEGSFALTLLVTDAQFTQGASDWTVEDFYRLARESGISRLGNGLDRRAVLIQCLKWLGEGVYDRELVRQSILFAEQYGMDPSAASEDRAEGKPGRDYMIQEVTLTSPLSLADIQEYYGENIVFMGYPGMQGAKVIHANFDAVSINKSSGHKDGAWAFIRFLLGREYQFTMDGTGFPLWKEAYEARIAYYRRPKTYDVYLPEAGGIITVENKHTLPRSMSEIESMSEEQIRLLDRLVEESKVNIWEAETNAVNIILEEAESYYRGDKDVEQVLDVILSRLEMYRGERE